jgi:hypothetical protein|tara:strand:- start:32 stop:664 length:633 start_codon:yes stop_codon:yes gene_type:complete
MQYLFGKKNSKHDKEDIYSSSLPAVDTCIGCTAFCKSICLARVGNFTFPNVQEGYQERLKLSLSECFVPVAVKELTIRKHKGKHIKYVRWHVSGDVYSQGYLEKLVEIARQVPQVEFFMYTKSTSLDWTGWEKLPNTVVIHSDGGKYPINKRKPHATIFNSKEDIPDDYTDCSKSDLLAMRTAKEGNGNIALILLKGGRKSSATKQGRVA